MNFIQLIYKEIEYQRKIIIKILKKTEWKLIYEKNNTFFSILLSGISHIKATIAYNKMPIVGCKKEKTIPKM